MTSDATVAPRVRPILNQVLANAGVLLGGRTANALISLAYMAVAARALGVDQVGVLILINAFAQLVGEVVKFNSWQTVLRFGAAPLADGRREQLQQVIRFTMFLDFASGLVGVTVAAAVAYFAGQRLGWGAEHAPAAALYCLTAAMLTPATATGILRLFNRFDVLAAQAPIGSAVRLVGGGAALVLGVSLNAFLLIWALGTIAAFAYVTAASVGELRRRGLMSGFKVRGPLTAGLPGAWRFAWATNFSSGVDTAFTHVITLVVGGVVGPGPAALWRIGRQVADAMAKPAKLLVPALYPELARLHVTHGEHAMRRLALQVGLLGGGVGTLLLLVAAIAGRPLLGFILGESFEAGAGVMTWQVAAAVIGIWALPLEPMLVSLGRPGDVLKVRLVVCVALLAVLVPVTRAFGLAGAGAALVCAMVGLAVGMFLMLQRNAGAAPAPYEIACAEDPAQAKRNP
jgi:O-antigen/teichoic acid export membrane protein